MSKRQDRKNERASKKDKAGNSMALSRAVRRSLQRLQRRTNEYEASPKSKNSGQTYTKPGSKKSW